MKPLCLNIFVIKALYVMKPETRSLQYSRYFILYKIYWSLIAESFVFVRFVSFCMIVYDCVILLSNLTTIRPLAKVSTAFVLFRNAVFIRCSLYLLQEIAINMSNALVGTRTNANVSIECCKEMAAQSGARRKNSNLKSVHFICKINGLQLALNAWRLNK